MRQLVQNAHVVSALSNTAVTSVTPSYVSLKNYQHVTAVISLKTATGAAAGAITLKQATAVAGTSEKALSFSYQWANTDVAAGETLTKTAVTSDTFNSAGVAVKQELYVIEIDTDTLDVDNSFDCFRVALANMAATTATVTYILSQPRFIDQTTHQTARVD